MTVPAERWFGSQLSRQICRHHERRLGRIGWERALDPPAGGWAETEPPPRAGNRVDVLIDGAEALPAIAEAMLKAESHVHLTGWYFTPSFALVRDGDPLVLRDLLSELAERIDVRVLAWAGAPLPLFRPSRADVREMRDRLVDRSRTQVALDAHERPMHCHHEKTIVIDDRVAFVGGVDLTSEAGDRFDARHHPARATVGWHDVATRIEGPAVADVAASFNMRWHEVTGERLARTCRCRARRRGRGAGRPHGSGEDLQGRARRATSASSSPTSGRFASAERFIYLENQFLWSPEIAAVLADKIANPPSEDFRLARAPAREAEHRRRRHARRARRAARGGRRRRPGLRLDDLRPHRRSGPIRSTSTPRSGSSTTAG